MLTVVETPLFSRRVTDYWTEDERGEFAAWLAHHPDASVEWLSLGTQRH